MDASDYRRAGAGRHSSSRVSISGVAAVKYAVGDNVEELCMHTSIPDPVQTLLDEYVDLLRVRIPGLVTALYLHGSIALGAFNPRFSDIDFIAVVSQPVSDSEYEHLKAIHQFIAHKYPSLPLQGSYLQTHHLGKFPPEIEPTPYFSDGILHRAGHHDLNSITWWLLKYHGVTVMGTPANVLPYSVDWELLVIHTQQNMDGYWSQYLRHPVRLATLLTDDGVQWTVLGVLRQWYTFETGDITSKTRAGEFAIKQLPFHWHQIIEEAIQLREGGRPLYRSSLLRAVDTWRFLRFIIRHCHNTYRF